MNHTWREASRSHWDTFKTIPAFALRAVMIGGPVAAIAYWVFVRRGVYVTRAELCGWLGILAWAGLEWLHYWDAQPSKMEFAFDKSAGYWCCKLQEPGGPNPFIPRTTYICFATFSEKDKIPEPHRQFGIQAVGKIHRVVDGKFWVWHETVPWIKRNDGGILVDPTVTISP
jgi:hypothetical protein